MAKQLKQICPECAQLAGKTERQLDRRALFHEGTCGICGNKKAVCETHWWGAFTKSQRETAQAEVARLGLHVTQKANPEDVRRLVDVVKGVLGDEFMSYETRGIIGKFEKDLENNVPIQLWDTKLLTTWYVADCAQMRMAKGVKELEDRRLHPGTEIFVIEGGHQRNHLVR
jgi:hypothetical protein